MLIKCPECELDISDKAYVCPHCGNPMRSSTPQYRTKNSNKRKRLPNGFGRITEIKNNRLRNRFRAMVSVGTYANGKPIAKLLKPQGYFPTYNDAYAALLEYNRNPYDLDVDISVKDLYERWTDEYFKTLKSPSSERTIKSAWAYCSGVYDMRACDIRARHIKSCMDEGRAIKNGVEKEPTAGIKGRIKSMFNLMLDYALEYEIVDKNYARTFDISGNIIKEKEEARRGHFPFTDSEMETLWNNVYEKKYVDVVLIQCYSGWRPQELGLIETEKVDLKEWLFTGGMKTDAGRNRIVPIHPKIRELVKNRYDEAVSIGSKYLITCSDAKTHQESIAFTYDKYRTRFESLKKELGLSPEHRAHDGRVHFITLAKKYNVDEYAIKYMVGHAINDITEKIYTKRELDWLTSEMKKIR